MSDMTINGATTTYADYQVENTAPKTEASKADETTKSEESTKPAATTKPAEDAGAVYEKSDDKTSTGSGLYNINKMSASDREALVKQLKADAENRQNQLMSLVSKMMTGQANTFAKTDDSIWKFLAKGDFTVDAATKAQAQKDISEDGYWGVKETSKRLFDFASALAGDDVDRMKEMQNAMMKGFKLAGKEWGRKLPDISYKTIDAANKLFEDYYASKNKQTDAAAPVE